jgi:hypothetical protein
MKILAAAAVAFLAAQSPAPAQEVDLNAISSAQIVAQASSLHPAALYVLSARLLSEGRAQEAANWMYAGQLRYRFMLMALGGAAGNDRVLYSALSEQVGRPVNEYVAGDPDDWIAAMQWALDWDAETPNDVTSKTRHAAELAEVRDGLQRLIAKVDGSRAQIRRDRAANRLPNR